MYVTRISHYIMLYIVSSIIRSFAYPHYVLELITHRYGGPPVLWIQLRMSLCQQYIKIKKKISAIIFVRYSLQIIWPGSHAESFSYGQCCGHLRVRIRE
jgi:hypothetical protein